MKLVVLILTAITLNNAALYAHWKYADSLYAKCAGYDEQEVKDCVNKDTLFRITGTILFTEGSYLE